MKKGGVSVTPIVYSKIEQPETFWKYLPQVSQQGPFEQYVQINQKDLYTLQQQIQIGFMDNIKQFAISINHILHPCLLQNNDTFLRFCNTKVDWLTLKLIHYFINNSNVITIDFRFNEFTQQEIDIVYQICNHQRIIKAFIEYNPIVNILKLSPLYNLEFIYLRGNKLKNDIIVQFMNNLHNRVRLLEFGNNEISQEGCDSIAQYMSKSNNLEYIGLAQNRIVSCLEVKLLAHSFGKVRLTAEEFQKIQELEQQREAQLAKFQKQKKKYTEDMLIQVPQYAKIDNFNYSLINPNFKILNLSDNELPENERDHVDKLLQRLLDTQTIVLTNNQFESSTKAKFRKKYKKCVVI